MVLGGPLPELSAHAGCFYAVVLQYALLLVHGCWVGLHRALQGRLGSTVLGYHALLLQHQKGASFAAALLLSQGTPEGCWRQAAYIGTPTASEDV